ncbi:YceI-like domain-containing protein [Anseongella ginsenosidimutans]|uniref:YceI-like domain-containing protein n=1 Tax=Anseongella ginsenosidimutans TaxID=496056 RepID=A0A4R3KY47_9SPHI|nr:YceI family protein [Anseongella ginsenosidimutans]TCS90204.1 YceI-like domain-containing protein [Anseongella ginsenosidimutans]
MKRYHVKYVVAMLLLMAGREAKAQVYQSYKSETSFFSKAPLEDIAARNDGGASVLNLGNAEIVFLIPIRGFQFRKSLMQEHFNENYLESDKYPTATFKGKILGFEPSRQGKQEVQAKGILSIHGVEKPVKAAGTLEKKGEELLLESSFRVALKDHGITIPRLVVRNIAEIVDVKLEYHYKPKTN